MERLRQESSALEREYKTRYTDYEAQLEQLRGELSRLRKDYTHLRAKRGTRVTRPSAGVEGGSVRDKRRVDEVTRENRELRVSVSVLQETILSKDQMIR